MGTNLWLKLKVIFELTFDIILPITISCIGFAIDHNKLTEIDLKPKEEILLIVSSTSSLFTGSTTLPSEHILSFISKVNFLAIEALVVN